MTTNQLPTCLVALRAEVGAVFVEAERRLEHRIKQCEDLFGSLGWEADQVRATLKRTDDEVSSLRETNAALVDRIGKAEEAWTRQNIQLNQANDEIRDLREVMPTLITPQQCADQVNKVHDELVQKLSAERRELETTQHLLQQAREERDALRKELSIAKSELLDMHLNRRALLKEHRGTQNLNRAQGERIAVLSQSLDILADMVREQQRKAEEADARRMQTEDDFGKLVGEHEDYIKKYEALRNEAVGICHEHGHHGGKDCPMCFPPRVTAEELFVRFKPLVYDLLKCIDNLTGPAVSALQYGNHHGHQTLHRHIVKYRRFLDNLQRQSPEQRIDAVPDEVLR